jgi:hypothetical protein
MKQNETKMKQTTSKCFTVAFGGFGTGLLVYGTTVSETK